MIPRLTTYTRGQLSRVAATVYAQFMIEYEERHPGVMAPTWNRLNTQSKLLWMSYVLAVLVGGQPTHHETWVNDLIVKLVKREEN